MFQSMAARTPSAPYRSTSSPSRRAPSSTAEIMAAMSPAKEGKRLLRTSISSTSRRRSPRCTSLRQGTIMPSAKSSVASTEKPPGSLPPVSPWWACRAWMATISPASSKTGA